MKKFMVFVQYTKEIELIVEADNEEEARVQAKKKLQEFKEKVGSINIIPLEV